MNKNIIVAPSILSADFSDVKSALTAIRSSGAQWVHLDVMDGMFVPNISFGPKFIEDMRKCTDLFFDTHLMIESPERYIDKFLKAGAQAITVHQEACKHLDSVINQIKSSGCRAGVAICPATPVSSIENVLDIVDMVLVMSVNPGFGGQKLIPYTIKKIKELAAIRGDRRYLISVDGGINSETIYPVAEAGIDVAVTGSAFFKAADKSEFVRNISIIS